VINAEEAVLGVCLADSQCFWHIADLLTDKDFGNRQRGRLFSIMVDRARKNEPFDPVTIADDYPELGDMAISLAQTEGWRRGNVRAYAQRVLDNAVARKVKQAGAQIAQLEGDDVLGQAQQLIGACLPRHAGQVKHIREFVKGSIIELQRRVDSTEPLTGIATSIPDLDRSTGGYQRGDLVIIGARPSVGKTAFVIQTMVNAARNGKNCLFFSLEMTGQKVSNRILAHVAQVNASGMTQPKLFDQADWGALIKASAEIQELPLHIDESPALTVEALCARARQLHAIGKLDLIAIDYLTQMTPPKAGTGADAWQIVTRALKALAKELDIVVILLSQLNREGEGVKPHMAHLRDSGAIEQDADLIIFLHPHNDHVLLIIGKQREGERIDIPLIANRRHQRFTQDDFPMPEQQKEKRGMSRYPRRQPTPSPYDD
jgi:replicative DNA helicase